MKCPVEYNPEFYIDLEQAIDWYNEKKAGLGYKFYKTIKRQTSELSSSALHFAIKYDDIRCMPVDKFPYLIHYRYIEQTKTVKVEALFHTSRNPEIWDERK